MMHNVTTLPESGGKIDDRVRCQMTLTTTQPRGYVVGAHERRESEGCAMHCRFQRLTAANIQNRKHRADTLGSRDNCVGAHTPTADASLVLSQAAS